MKNDLAWTVKELFISKPREFIRDLLPYSIPCTLYPSHGINKSNQKQSVNKRHNFMQITHNFMFLKKKCITFTENVCSSVPVMNLTITNKHVGAKVL